MNFIKKYFVFLIKMLNGAQELKLFFQRYEKQMDLEN